MLEFFEEFKKVSKCKNQDVDPSTIKYEAMSQLHVTFDMPESEVDYLEDVALAECLNYFYKDLPNIISELVEYANSSDGIDFSKVKRIQQLKNNAMFICGGQ